MDMIDEIGKAIVKYLKGSLLNCSVYHCIGPRGGWNRIAIYYDITITTTIVVRCNAETLKLDCSAETVFTASLADPDCLPNLVKAIRFHRDNNIDIN